MKTALLFPGQGSQRPGMLAGLPDHPAVAETLDEAAAALGRDWRALDAAEALAAPEGAQLALVVSGVAAARVLVAEGAEIDVVAGHSVGAFPAAVAAGTLGFADALRLVGLRGRLMAECRPSGYGMVAILGLRERAVRELVERASEAGELFVANRNAETQIVVSGAELALGRVSELARAAGARKTERLKVASPSHCPLVGPVADALEREMASIQLAAPRIPYVSARRARLIQDAAAIGEDLARNVAEPVLWRDAARLLRELGVEVLIETPPGSTLIDLAAESWPDARAIALDRTPIGTAVRLAGGG